MPSKKPWERPSLKEIDRRMVSDFEFELGTQAPRLAGTVEHAYVRAGAGVAHGLHGRIDRTRLDAFWATSSDEALIQKAGLFGVFHIPASRSTGIISLGGEIGTVVPVNTIFVRDDGFTYITTASVEAAGEGVALCPARATASGQAGNMTPGTKLKLQEPIVNMDDEGNSSELGWQNGEEPESTESLRRRLAQRLASPPKGGGPGDYIRWALGDGDEEKIPPGVLPPAGVTRAWEYGKVPKIGNVTVLVMRDGDDDPFPDAIKLQEVKDWIMLFAPIAFPDVEVLAPNPHPINPTIELTLEDNADPGETKAAITQALLDMIATRAEPPKDDEGVFYKSWLNEAISSAPGELDHKVTVPADDIALAQWDLITLGTITWLP
jgi:uncharacterized phage protein gp47/JayE